MDLLEIKGIVEGLLFVSGDEGISLKQICKVLDISEETAKHIIDELKYDYDRNDRGIMIMESHHILHLTTKPEHSDYYKKLVEIPRSTRLSQAALETLAIIAYRQPITKTEIEEIRGVKSDGPVNTLLGKSLIEEMGRKDAVGRPILYGTSKEFLIFFGLTSLEELPPLPEDTEDSDINQEADLFFERFNEEINNDMES